MLAMAGSLSLAGCATMPPTPTVATRVCIPVVEYTPAQEQALAIALEDLAGGSPLVTAMTDYGAMRAAARAACASH